MSRYIDADEALRMMRNSQLDNPCEASRKGIWHTAHESCISCVDAAPTADVEAVRHGTWLPIIERSSYLDPPFYDTAKCSSCGYVADVSEMRYKYCPECGAKMDGERGQE